MKRVLILLGLFVLLATVGKAQNNWKDIDGEYINAHGGGDIGLRWQILLVWRAPSGQRIHHRSRGELLFIHRFM